MKVPKESAVLLITDSWAGSWAGIFAMLDFHKVDGRWFG